MRVLINFTLPQFRRPSKRSDLNGQRASIPTSPKCRRVLPKAEPLTVQAGGGRQPLNPLGTLLSLPPFLHLRALGDALKCCRDFSRRRYRPPDRTPTTCVSPRKQRASSKAELQQTVWGVILAVATTGRAQAADSPVAGARVPLHQHCPLSGSLATGRRFPASTLPNRARAGPGAGLRSPRPLGRAEPFFVLTHANRLETDI